MNVLNAGLMATLMAGNVGYTRHEKQLQIPVKTTKSFRKKIKAKKAEKQARKRNRKRK